MLLEYYNLLEQPFGVTPDTRFLYLNHMYCEALASLWYGIEERRGFIALVAHPGMGKTTLLFQLLQRLRRTSARTVFLFQTCCSADDLIRYLLLDLGIWPSSDAVSMRYQLNEALCQEARAGRQVVFVIDEAQNLSAATLESVRLLSDFETSQGKLLQIVLAGQPQLVNTLMKPEMLQLTQRLSVTTFLDPLDAEEVGRYVRHRLGVAGYQGKPLFTPDALQLVAEESQGIPRNINNICFGAMSMAFGLQQKRIDREIVESVAADQNLRSLGRRAILLEHQRARSQRGELPETSARTTQTASMQRKSIPSGIGRYARVTACLLAFLLLLTPSMATGLQPATRVLVSAENRSISVATTLTPKFEATALESSVAKTEPAIQVGLPNRSSDYHVAVVGPRHTLRQICLRCLGRYSLRTAQQIQALNSGLDPNRIEIGQRIRLPLSPAPQNSTRSLQGKREGQPIVALAK
jgi:type II secretory pathway predicted ATPase ExeA